MGILKLCGALLCGLLLGIGLATRFEPGAAQASSRSSSDAAEPVGAGTDMGSAGSGVVDAQSGLVSLLESGRVAVWLEELEALDDFERIGAIHASLRGFPVSRSGELLEGLRTMSSSPAFDGALELIGKRWARADPGAMAAYLSGLAGGERNSLARILYPIWIEADPEAAFAAARLISERWQDARSVNRLIDLLAQAAPDRALGFAEEYFGADLGTEGRWTVQQIFARWSELDGPGARARALGLEESRIRAAALAGAMRGWVRAAPVEALTWLEELPLDGAVYQSQREVFRYFLNEDLDAAIAYIDTVENEVRRRELLEHMHFHDLAEKASFEEIEAIFDWLDTVATGQVYDSRVSGVVAAMTERDPERAIRFVDAMRPGNARMNALAAVSQKLAEKDPVRAFAFVDSLAFIDEKRRALSNMGWPLMQRGASEAGALIAQQADPMVQQQLAARVAGQWAEYDIEAARQWSESLSDERARKASLRVVLGRWIERDAGAALDYVANALETDDRGSVLRDAFGHWARFDPEAAVAGLKELPESLDSVRSSAYRSVANNFIRHDPRAASEWIASLESGAERDQSVTMLVRQIAPADPEAAFIWAATVDDPDSRGTSLRRSVLAWSQSDPERARGAVEAASLSAAEKAPLLSILE